MISRGIRERNAWKTEENGGRRRSTTQIYKSNFTVIWTSGLIELVKVPNFLSNETLRSELSGQPSTCLDSFFFLTNTYNKKNYIQVSQFLLEIHNTVNYVFFSSSNTTLARVCSTILMGTKLPGLVIMWRLEIV